MNGKYGLCAIAKNEGPYIVEWIDFHLRIGFDHVTVYDNDSTDEGLSALRSYRNTTVIDWPSVVGRNNQNAAYEDYFHKYAPHFEWVMHLDVDEFLNLKKFSTLKSFLDEFDDVDGVAVNWRMFGSSGLKKYEPGSVLSRFERASLSSFPPNAHVKTIYRPKSIERPYQHSPVFKNNAVLVDTQHRVLPEHANVYNHDIDLQNAQINHYFTKSYEEFLIKRARGKADVPDEEDPNKYRELVEFDYYDRNEEEDTTILRRHEKLMSMDRVLDAVHWYKTLTFELGENTTWGTPGEGGLRAQQRVKGLIELFFNISDEMGLTELLEIGAHDAEASRRFAASAAHRSAVGYDASPSVVARVTAAGLPERFSLHHKAIGTAKGTITFFSPRDPFYAVWGSTARRGGFSDVEEITVPIISMDEAADNLSDRSSARNVALWVDVEGVALDVLRSGRHALSNKVALLYVELNDKNAYEGSANAVNVIALMLECDFVPLARDNEYPDAWNLIFVHKSYFDEPREAFMRWTYSLLPGSPY